MAEIILGGICPPLPTFFDEREEIDFDTFQRHVRWLQEQGIHGFVVMGSNGEAPHLTTNERAQLIAAAREAVGGKAQLIAGCGEQSTRATLHNCDEAARNGADVALILPPFYYKGRMDGAALLAHYRAIADASPLPVVIYNMPASAAGLDLDAAIICALAEHPKIIGVKDSAGNMAKLAHIVASTAQMHTEDTHTSAPFAVFAGSAGYLLPALAVGAVGAVAALANVFPRQVCAVQELFQAGKLMEARLLQARLVPANSAVTSIYSIAGLKAALELTAGYGGNPRSPVQPLNEQERERLAGMLRTIQQGM